MRDLISTSDEALRVLKEGNVRFVNECTTHPNIADEHRKSLKKNQKPFAAIVGCSDSRVPIEVIFDCGIGDIFVIRTAGNTLSSDATLGSLEYAIKYLGVRLVVVMAHTNCGAITAAINYSGDASSALYRLVSEIRSNIGDCNEVNKAVELNSAYQIKHLNSQELIKKYVDSEDLKVVSALYNIETGKVTFK